MERKTSKQANLFQSLVEWGVFLVMAGFVIDWLSRVIDANNLTPVLLSGMLVAGACLRWLIKPAKHRAPGKPKKRYIKRA